MRPILEIQGISKKFSISHQSHSYLTVRDSLATIFGSGRSSREEFWALRDVSFDVKPGESIGIIGRNGAGKSTLLKILSKITPPSQGRIVCRGRLASLLEVGTGFHPELTGRENIFLNGSLLGMKRREITSKFDEIVDFAGTEKFLDTPLKHYSSGMQLRLAFAVAAFLEPEILVIDEVLAVGDAEFQKKCMGKMEDVSKSGRTILFVSHNMSAVLNLCSRSVLLDQGKLLQAGPSNEIAKLYWSLNDEKAEGTYQAEKGGELFFSRIVITTGGKEPSTRFDFEADIGVSFTIKSAIDTKSMTITLGVLTKNGDRVFFSEAEREFTMGLHDFFVRIPGGNLLPGEYFLYMAIHVPNTFAFDQVEVCPFSILETGSPFQKYAGKWDCGMVVVKCDWT